MATVGDVLLTPEKDWIRVDNTSPSIKYAGSWSIYSAANQYGGSLLSAIDKGSSYSFTFYGTAFRLIDVFFTNRTKSAIISIDGVSETVSFYGDGTNPYPASTHQVIYEKLNLPLGKHTITVTKDDDSTSLSLAIDAVDIIGAFTTFTIGAQLTVPEAGWKRYDDTKITGKYSGTSWIKGPSASCYLGTYTQIAVSTGENSVEFKFYGSKLRIISAYNPAYAPSVDIYIDGVKNSFLINTGGTFQVLAFEATGLSIGEHTVVIKQQAWNNAGFVLDAVDVDDIGYIVTGLPPTTGELRQTLRDMKVGDFALMHYDASINKWVLGGTGGKEEGSVDGIAVGTHQSYYFYAIKIAKGLLVADRVWYHSASWDQLNTWKNIEGQPLTLTYADDTGISIPITVRAPRGGVAYADVNGSRSLSATGSIGCFPLSNEWDKYLIGFPADKIQSGKTVDDIFHHLNIWTWTQEATISGTQVSTTGTTATLGTDKRTMRGYEGVDAKWKGFGGGTSSAISNQTGFRPVFEYKEV